MRQEDDCGSRGASRWLRPARRPRTPVHFAGEHTSAAHEGFLEGAVESGERAARELLARIAS